MFMEIYATIRKNPCDARTTFPLIIYRAENEQRTPEALQVTM